MAEKATLSDLCLFGGSPTFDNVLHVGSPNIGDRSRLLERLNDMLDRRWLTNNGLYVQEFERKIADCLDVKHCICMCNGTIALEIAIRALGLSGEVIVPSFTFIATAHALQWQGITPVFCDINSRNHTLDPYQIEKMLTPRTTGIIGVHLWGSACEIDALEEIAHRHNLTLLFDAAHAFGCSYRGRLIGCFGAAEVFSFHATKFFNCFEGGAVVTNDDELAAKIRLMKNFGFAGNDKVIYIGTNGKMSEMSAAMGLTSLESIDEFISANFRNYRLYKEYLSDITGINLVVYNENERCNFQYIILEIDETVTQISRDDIVKVLAAENVMARRYFYPGCHQMEPYVSYFPHASLLLPATEQLVTRVMSLPTGTAVSSDNVAKICELIRLTVTNGSEISECLRHSEKPINYLKGIET